MNSDELRSKVLESISERELDERLEKKIELLGGLCDRKTAMLLVAHELGIDDNETTIGDMDESARSASFAAVVLSVLSMRSFSRDDGSAGVVANLFVGDESGTARVVLWDEVAELVKSGKVSEGKCYRFSGRLKDGRDGRELHIDRWGNITPLKKLINPAFEPAPLSSLNVGMEADVLVRVLSSSPLRTFSRKDGSEGAMREAMVADESGYMGTVLWDRAASFEPLESGNVLEVRRARMKEGRLTCELHLGAFSHMALSEKSVVWSPEITPLSGLRMGQLCCVEGMVSGIGELRSFQRGDDKDEGVLSELHLSDNDDRARVVLWGEHAHAVKELDFGEHIRVLFCTVRDGRDGPELSTTKLSIVEKL